MHLTRGVSENMLNEILNSSNFNYLGRGMAAANLRQEVISNNIANVNTPNFKKSDVVFEDLLARELQLDGNSGEMPVGRTNDWHLPMSADPDFQLVRTHEKHLPAGPQGPVQAKVVEDDSTTMRVDGNNVDIDVEMANLAKNQLYYNAMATQMGNYISRIKNAITSGQG
jgi:flagellar basal-body rod protein FlgB